MLHARAGSRAEAGFLRDVADGLYELVQVTAADALVVAVAERFRAVNIATLDRRHFSIVRPTHTAASTLLP